MSDRERELDREEWELNQAIERDRLDREERRLNAERGAIAFGTWVVLMVFAWMFLTGLASLRTSSDLAGFGFALWYRGAAWDVAWMLLGGGGSFFIVAVLVEVPLFGGAIGDSSRR